MCGPRWSSCLGFLLVLAATAARAEDVVETYPDGTPHRVYTTDEEGLIHGRLVERHPNGKVSLRARYRHGVLNGTYETFHEGGRKRVRCVYRDGMLTAKYEAWDAEGRLTYEARYKTGQLHGKVRAWREGTLISMQVWFKGTLVVLDDIRMPTRTRDGIRERLAGILDVPPNVPGTLSPMRALARLKAYRYLCGVPWEDLAIDEGYSALAQAASRLCAAIGRITHTPPNPGWPKAEYERGARGAAACNLHQGFEAVASIDGYMDDSDPSNIDQVGHRCWCLNPTMKETGFGAHAGKGDRWFTAMWAMDDSRPPLQHLDRVAYPPAGWMPLDFFGPRHAWSLQLSRRHFPRVVPERVRVTVRRLDERFLPAAEALPLDFLRVNLDAHGLPVCVIFRPENLVLRDGDAYDVEVTGLDAKAKRGKDVTVRYVVRFFDRKS